MQLKMSKLDFLNIELYIFRVLEVKIGPKILVWVCRSYQELYYNDWRYIGSWTISQ